MDVWLAWYAAEGIAGLLDRRRGAGREQMPGRIRVRILAATSAPARSSATAGPPAPARNSSRSSNER
ncbi:hypothetical protein [Nocardia sp. CNY236]|uniref:hypothetical protein n=1 Tax=Nocardia sp. CNY236 TaxID=1169152 RepID=UPI00350F7175